MKNGHVALTANVKKMVVQEGCDKNVELGEHTQTWGRLGNWIYWVFKKHRHAGPPSTLTTGEATVGPAAPKQWGF